MVRTTSIVSRRRRTPFSKRTPCQPSMTWWPEVPSPSTNRPPEMLSSEAAVCAMSAGLRLKTFTMPVASFTRSVWQAISVRSVKASQP